MPWLRYLLTLGAAGCASAILLALAGCQQVQQVKLEPSPGAHHLPRVEECLRNKGRRVEGVERVQQLNVKIRLQVAPGGFIQQLYLWFFPTVADARAWRELLTRQTTAWGARQIDNVVYNHPSRVRNRVFADIEECIRSS